MRTRSLGRSGLIVSEFALGAMTFGKEADEQTAHTLLDRYADTGGNFIDAADVSASARPASGSTRRSAPALTR
jgi:aryl-alcohol dehydrogenase-like predicted oxidoreductase